METCSCQNGYVDVNRNEIFAVKRMDDDSEANLPEAEEREYEEDDVQKKTITKKNEFVQKTEWFFHLRKKLNFYTHHHYFQIFICILVLLDTAVVVTEIMVETSNKDGTINHHMEVAEKVLHYTSLSILTFFMIEIIVKIFAMGKEFVHHKFEIFDAVIVTISFFLDLFLSSGGIKDGVEFLILLRLWRITRIINGIIVSIKTRAEEREAKLQQEKKEVMQKCAQLENKLGEQKKEIEHLKERLLFAGVDITMFSPDAVKDERFSVFTQ